MLHWGRPELQNEPDPNGYVIYVNGRSVDQYRRGRSVSLFFCPIPKAWGGDPPPRRVVPPAMLPFCLPSRSPYLVVPRVVPAPNTLCSRKESRSLCMFQRLPSDAAHPQRSLLFAMASSLAPTPAVTSTLTPTLTLAVDGTTNNTTPYVRSNRSRSR